MKKGKWNYIEDIEYTVIEVILKEGDSKYHWQNSVIGEKRQVVAIRHGKRQFWIDNEDGSGLLKIMLLGSPNQYSAHLSSFDFVREVPEGEWKQWDQEVHHRLREKHQKWMFEKYPEAYEQMKALREQIESFSNRKP